MSFFLPHRLVLAPVLAFLVMITQAGAQETSRLERVLQSGTLRVGTTGDFNPMSFRDPETREYAGYDIDVVRQFAADIGVEVQFVPTDWKTIVQGVVADKYDMTTSASVSMARAAVAGYSQAFIEYSTVPVARADEAGAIAGWAGLDSPETTIAVTLGTVFDEQARAFFEEARITAVESPARGFQEVLAGRATATITSNVDAAQLTETYPELAVVEVERPRARRPGAFLLPQGDQVWINYVNHWVDLGHASGLFEALKAKWNIAD